MLYLGSDLKSQKRYVKHAKFENFTPVTNKATMGENLLHNFHLGNGSDKSFSKLRELN